MQSSKMCVSKRFLIVSFVLLLLIGFVTSVNYVSSTKLSQNSRASEPQKTTALNPKGATSVVEWQFLADSLCGDCLVVNRTPSLSPPGLIKIIKNNRWPESITPSSGSNNTYVVELNNDPTVQRVSFEGPIDSIFSLPANFEWQYCNAPSVNPVSSLGTYWLVRTGVPCPLITEPSPTPELLPDLTIDSIVTSDSSTPSQYWVKTVVKNNGQIATKNFDTYVYVDPLVYPPPLATPPTFYNHLGANLSPGSSYSFSKTLTLTPGAHKIYAWVDIYNAIPEYREDDNTKGCSATIVNGAISSCSNNVYIPFVQTAPDIIITIPVLPLSGNK